MVRVHPPHLLRPVAVHKLPSCFVRQILDLAPDLLPRSILIHKTQPPRVQQHKPGRPENASHMVGAGGVWAVL